MLLFSSFTSIQRAWFGVSDFEVIQYDPDEARKPFRMQLLLRNSGKTPALQIKALGMFRVYNSKSDGPADSDWKAFQDFFKKDKGRYVAAPNTQRKFIATDANDHVVTSRYSDIKSHTAFAYYFGQIAYADVDGTPHTTRFCFWLAEPENKQFAYCEKGNDMN